MRVSDRIRLGAAVVRQTAIGRGFRTETTERVVGAGEPSLKPVPE